MPLAVFVPVTSFVCATSLIRNFVSQLDTFRRRVGISF